MFHHFAKGAWGADSYSFWRVGSYRRCNHLCQIVSGLHKGLWSYDTQDLVFPIDFDRRPYNSVTHYRATQWSFCTIVLASFILNNGYHIAETSDYGMRYNSTQVQRAILWFSLLRGGNWKNLVELRSMQWNGNRYCHVSTKELGCIIRILLSPWGRVNILHHRWFT